MHEVFTRNCHLLHIRPALDLDLVDFKEDFPYNYVRGR